MVKEVTKEKQPVKVKPFKKQLACKLSREELYEYSRELARETAELRECEGRKSEVLADFTASIKKFQAGISVLSRKVTTEEEYREVDCQWIMDFHEGNKELIRKDTGEVLGGSQITDEDKQTKFELE